MRPSTGELRSFFQNFDGLRRFGSNHAAVS
jgi:hypothetical protein